MADVAIYHPSINVPAGNWLQLSLLYWERLLRVLPSEDSRPAPRHIAVLEDAGLITRIDPQAALDEVERLFVSLVEGNEQALRIRYDLSLGSAWRNPHGGPWEADPGITYIHAGKVGPRLTAVLLDSGLAKWDPAGWIGTHPRLARTYMAVMADRIGAASGATPVTDDPMAHLLAGHWSADRLRSFLVCPTGPDAEIVGKNELSAALALISIQAVVPMNPLSVEELVTLRRTYGDELLRFRDFMTATVAEAGLESVSRPDALQMHLMALYDRRIAPELEKLKRDLKLLRVGAIEAAINLRTTLPTTFAFALSQAGMHDSAVAAGAAAIVSIVGVGHGLASARQDALASNPTAFLWQLDKFSDGGELHRMVLNTFRRTV